MTEGSNQGLFVIIAVVIFGIFISLGYFLFGDILTPALSNTFKDVSENAMDILNNDTQSAEDIAYEEWVEDLENQEYVVAEDTDFDGDVDGEFRYIGNDKKVIVPKIIKGVTITKATYMFENNTPVKAVAINNPNVIDMSYMFYNNQSTSLDVSNLVTENVDNMKYMFFGSRAIILDLSSFDTSNVTDMSYMFYQSRATSIDVSSFDTSNVTNMKMMFYSSKATSLDVSSFDTSKVTSMYGMFMGSDATTLNLSSFDTSNVTTMEDMFSFSKATMLDLSSFDTSNVTSMYTMFFYSEATSLDLSSFDTSKVTHMYGMFMNSKATTAYARTESDANKFKSSTGKPSTLIIAVK